jgi:hypothetical protein
LGLLNVTVSGNNECQTWMLIGTYTDTHDKPHKVCTYIWQRWASAI